MSVPRSRGRSVASRRGRAGNRSPRGIGYASLLLGFVILVFGLIRYGGETVTEAQPQPEAPKLEARGTESQPKARYCKIEWGHNLCDEPDGAQMLSFFGRSQGTMGNPITEYLDSNTQVFMNAVAVYNPAEKEGWKIQLRNLGTDFLGGAEDRNAQPAPVVADFINSKGLGEEKIRYFGYVASAVTYAPNSENDPRLGTGQCVQYYDKARLRFNCIRLPSGRIDPESITGPVTIDPLGLLSQPKPKVEVVQPVVRAKTLGENLPLVVTLFVSFLPIGFGIWLLVMASRYSVTSGPRRGTTARSTPVRRPVRRQRNQPTEGPPTLLVLVIVLGIVLVSISSLMAVVGHMSFADQLAKIIGLF